MNDDIVDMHLAYPQYTWILQVKRMQWKEAAGWNKNLVPADHGKRQSQDAHAPHCFFMPVILVEICIKTCQEEKVLRLPAVMK